MSAETPARDYSHGDGTRTGVGVLSQSGPLTSTVVDGGHLDDLDRRLIEELQHDGRVPFADLARLTQSSEKTIRRRVHRLVEDRYITISAVTDPGLLGFGAMGLALITVGAQGDASALAHQLSAFEEVDYVTVTTGPFGVQAELMCLDSTELQSVVRRIRSLDGVSGVDHLAYLRLHYQQAEMAPASSEAGELGVRPRSLDDLDQRVIANLAANGRISFREIARDTEMSEASIRNRYSRLCAERAVHVMGIVNPLRLGYRYTSWVGIRSRGSHRAQDLADALAELSRVSYVVLTAGRFDVLAEVVSSTGSELISFLDDSVRPIVGVDVVEIWVYQDLLYKPLYPRRGAQITSQP